MNIKDIAQSKLELEAFCLTNGTTNFGDKIDQLKITHNDTENVGFKLEQNKIYSLTQKISDGKLTISFVLTEQISCNVLVTPKTN